MNYYNEKNHSNESLENPYSLGNQNQVNQYDKKTNTNFKLSIDEYYLSKFNTNAYQDKEIKNEQFGKYNYKEFMNQQNQNQQHQLFAKTKTKNPDYSFLNKQKEKYGISHNQKFTGIMEQLFELKFLKQNVVSLIKEMQMRMKDQMRQFKRYLFQLQIKVEKDLLQSSRRMKHNDSNQSSVMMIHNFSSKTLNQSDRSFHHEHLILKEQYKNLNLQNAELKSKYQAILLRSKEQIQNMSNILKLNCNFTNHPQENIYEQEIQQLRYQNKKLQFQVNEAQEKLKNQQQKYVSKIKKMQETILEFENEYTQQKQKYQSALERYRVKERNYNFIDAELENRKLQIIEREKAINDRQIMLKQQKLAIDRRQQMISNFEYGKVKRERQAREADKDRLRSEYFNNERINDQRYLLQQKSKMSRYTQNRYERQRSQDRNIMKSRIDINSRLRQIETQKRNNHGIGGSRISNYSIGHRSDRNYSKDIKLIKKDTGLTKNLNSNSNILPKEYINVNEKLQSIINSLSKQLNEIR